MRTNVIVALYIDPSWIIPFPALYADQIQFFIPRGKDYREVFCFQSDHEEEILIAEARRRLEALIPDLGDDVEFSVIQLSENITAVIGWCDPLKAQGTWIRTVRWMKLSNIAAHSTALARVFTAIYTMHVKKRQQQARQENKNRAKVRKLPLDRSQAFNWRRRHRP